MSKQKRALYARFLGVYLIFITVRLRVLNTDIIIGVFRECGVLCKSRAVHQVEEIAVVGAKVQHGRGAGPAVSLLDEHYFELCCFLHLICMSDFNSHIDAAVVCLLSEGECHVINVALNWCGVRTGGHKALSAVVLKL